MCTDFIQAQNRGKGIQIFNTSKKNAENITICCISQNCCLGFCGGTHTLIYETYYSLQTRKPGGQGGGQSPDPYSGLDDPPVQKCRTGGPGGRSEQCSQRQGIPVRLKTSGRLY